MIAVKARFDGRMIEVPEELRGKSPSEVVVIYDDAARDPVAAADAPSIWNFLGAAKRKRSAADIEKQIRNERNSWDEP